MDLGGFSGFYDPGPRAAGMNDFKRRAGRIERRLAPPADFEPRTVTDVIQWLSARPAGDDTPSYYLSQMMERADKAQGRK